MNIIVNTGKKEKVIKISEETFLCILPSSLLKSRYKRMLKLIGATENDIYYVTENINPKILKALSHITAFSEINTAEIFFSNISNILKNISVGEKMDICIYSEKEDDRIFKLISSVNNFCSVIYLATKNDSFYEKVADYALTNYGIGIQSRETNTALINIVLNTEDRDFLNKNGYVINLSEIELEAKNLLYDILPCNLKSSIRINIKKCCFLEENCQNFNLIWKNSQKAVDKSEK